MWYSFWSYINFIFSATNQHGVHSPFVYNLVTKCFYNRTKRKSYGKIQSIINLRADETSFQLKTLDYNVLYALSWYCYLHIKQEAVPEMEGLGKFHFTERCSSCSTCPFMVSLAEL